MKKYSVWVFFAFAVGIALIVAACTLTQPHGPGVSIHETSVEIYPGTKISSDDQKALNAVLKKFDKSLYKIRTYESGKLVTTQGSLKDALIPQTLVVDATKSSQEGVSFSTLQIGNPHMINFAYTKQQSPTPAPVTERGVLEHSKRLVRLVTPILQKYSR